MKMSNKTPKTAVQFYELYAPRFTSFPGSETEKEVMTRLNKNMNSSEAIAYRNYFDESVKDKHTFLFEVIGVAFEKRYNTEFKQFRALLADTTGSTFDIAFSIDNCELPPDCLVEVETEFGNFFVGFTSERDENFLLASTGYFPAKGKGRDSFVEFIACLGYGENNLDFGKAS